MQEQISISECTDNLIEEAKVYHQGKVKNLNANLKKQIGEKKAGMRWNGTKYVPQTGAQKASYKRASLKRKRTMKTGKAARAVASRKNARIRSQVKRSANTR